MNNTDKLVTSNRLMNLARFFGALSNPSRIALLEKLACNNACIKDDFIEFDGMSKFTVGMNLKYLKKHGLINGNLSSKKLSYCLNYQKLDELKQQFDDFYNRLNQNRGNDEASNGNCLK